MKYSIIIPVHNNSKTLAATMHSVMAQLRPFDEIILVENCSTDDSLRMCYDYQKQHENVQVLTSKKAGLSLARNLGIKAATGDYLFLLDADDTLHEPLLLELDYIVRQLLATNQTFDLYEVNYNHYFAKNKYVQNPFILPKGKYRGDAYLNRSLATFREETKFMAWRFLYRRNFFITGRRFFDEDVLFLEDIAFMQKYLTKDVTIYVTGDTPFVNYLFNEQSLTQTKKATLPQAISQVYRTIKHPSELQNIYFLALAAKVLSREKFIEFAVNDEHYDRTQAFFLFDKLTMQRLFNRLKRRLQRAYDS